MTVMQIRRVRMLVLKLLVPMPMRMLAVDGWLVHMIVVSITMCMRVLMFNKLMDVSVPVFLGKVKPDPRGECDCANRRAK